MPEAVAMDDKNRFQILTDDEHKQSTPTSGGSAKDDGWDPIVPVPDTVPDPSMDHWVLGKPVGSWPYRNASGDRLCFMVRYNKADRGKEYHTIEVRVRREGLNILAREGYYAGAAPR